MSRKSTESPKDLPNADHTHRKSFPKPELLLTSEAYTNFTGKSAGESQNTYNGPITDKNQNLKQTKSPSNTTLSSCGSKNCSTPKLKTVTFQETDDTNKETAASNSQVQSISLSQTDEPQNEKRERTCPKAIFEEDCYLDDTLSSVESDVTSTDTLVPDASKSFVPAYPCEGSPSRRDYCYQGHFGEYSSPPYVKIQVMPLANRYLDTIKVHVTTLERSPPVDKKLDSIAEKPPEEKGGPDKKRNIPLEPVVKVNCKGRLPLERSLNVEPFFTPLQSPCDAVPPLSECLEKILKSTDVSDWYSEAMEAVLEEALESDRFSLDTISIDSCLTDKSSRRPKKYQVSSLKSSLLSLLTDGYPESGEDSDAVELLMNQMGKAIKFQDLPSARFSDIMGDLGSIDRLTVSDVTSVTGGETASLSNVSLDSERCQHLTDWQRRFLEHIKSIPDLKSSVV